MSSNDGLRGRFALFCDNAFTGSDGKLNIIGEFDQLISTQGKPVLNRGFVVGSFRGEPNKKVEIVIKLVDDNDKDILPEQKLAVVIGPGGVAHIIFEIVGLVFEHSGIYKASFLGGDKNPIAEAQIKVTEGKNATKGPNSIN